MHSPLLRSAADLLAILDEAVICLFTSILFDTIERVVTLGNMQREEMLGGEVFGTFYTPERMCFKIVDFVIVVCGKFDGLVRRQSTSYGCVCGICSWNIQMCIFARRLYAVNRQIISNRCMVYARFRVSSSAFRHGEEMWWRGRLGRDGKRQYRL
jgi:hypothetical protein